MLKRRAEWVSAPSGPIAVWVHEPTVSDVRGGIVITPPFGHEHVHSYRTLLHLADRLALNGFATVRFDPHGVGSSDGTAFADQLVSKWLQDLAAIASWTEARTGAPTSLVGLRLGATLAALATHRVPVRHLVLWEPVLRGRRYVREMKALADLSSRDESLAAEHINTAGFIVASQTIEDLRRLDLLQSLPRVHGRVLLVERDDLRPADRYVRALVSNGVDVDVIRESGYLAMMAEPHDTVVPRHTVESVSDWLSEHSLETNELTVGRAEPVVEAAMGEVGGTEVRERFVEIPGASPLFGVLTVPGAGAGPAPLLLLANAGAVHQIGPNRLYVEIARSLAPQGFATLRFDLRNLGDSLRPGAAEENHPYPSTAVDDVARALAWMREEHGFDRIIVGGLCSGAHTAFHAALQLDETTMAGILPMNPLTFYWTPGMTLAIPSAHRVHSDAIYYRRSVRSLGSWHRLISGEADWGYIGRFAFRWLWSGVARPVTGLLERTGIHSASALARDVERLRAKGLTTDFLFSRSDPGHRILSAAARDAVSRSIDAGAMTVRFVECADHTFTGRAQREQVAAAVMDVLRRRFAN